MKQRLKKPWPFWVGGIVIGLLNVTLLALSGCPWVITGGYLLWGAGTLDLMGFRPFDWKYFSVYNNKFSEIIADHHIFINQFTLLNIGVIVGSLIATLLSSQFKIGKVKSLKNVAFAFAGGLLMGYGTRLTGGCNVGSFLSGIASFSLHAWIYWIFVILGTWIGAKIVIRFLA